MRDKTVVVVLIGSLYRDVASVRMKGLRQCCVVPICIDNGCIRHTDNSHTARHHAAQLHGSVLCAGGSSGTSLTRGLRRVKLVAI